MSERASEVAVVGRRRLLGLGAAWMAGVMLPLPALAATRQGAGRALRFIHLRTGETLEATYFAGGRHVEGELRRIDYFLRDFRTDEVMPIDRRLLDLLHALHAKVESRAPFQVISGYRSPATNAMLAARSSAVAKHSLHMEGMAIDLCLADCRLDRLRQAALALEGGGVGYYPRSSFVHIDTGPVRSW